MIEGQGMMMNNKALIHVPFGAVAITAHDNQLMIDLLTEPLLQEHQPSIHSTINASLNPLLKLACEQIMQYLQQPAMLFNLPPNGQGTNFQRCVWQAISEIPVGQTCTYGQLAKVIGSGARAVANACGANSMPIVIPCHRVVAQNGIGGFMQGQQNGVLIKKWLLAHEGVYEYADD